MNDQSERELLEFAREIRGIAHPTLGRARRSEIRASLIARPAPPPTGSWLLVLRPVLVAAVIVAVLAGAGGTAAADSLPGDPAFAAKRVAEEIEVALTFDDAAQLDVLVTQSDRRLTDLTTVVSSRASAIGAATDEYLAAVARLDAALSAVSTRPLTAARAAAIARASAASADHIAALRALAQRLPAAAQAGIERAITAQETVHGKSGGAPGRSGAPSPSTSSAPGRPSSLPTAPGRGGPPSAPPGRP